MSEPRNGAYIYNDDSYLVPNSARPDMALVAQGQEMGQQCDQCGQRFMAVDPDVFCRDWVDDIIY